MAIAYDMSDRGRIQPPADLQNDDDAYPMPGDMDGTLRVYRQGDEEMFSVTSIQSAVHGIPDRLKTWEDNVGSEYAEWWRNYTATRGTSAHEKILNQYADRFIEEEADIEGEIEEGNHDQIRKEVKRCLKMWKKVWTVQGHSFGDVRGVEIPVWNEEYGYAGRFDLLMYLDGKLTLVDLKTSKEYYPKYGEQLSAYQYAAEEMYGVDIEARAVIRMCPDRRHNPFMDPEVHKVPDKKQEWFDLCNEFHDRVLPMIKEEMRRREEEESD